MKELKYLHARAKEEEKPKEFEDYQLIIRDSKALHRVLKIINCQ